MRIYIKFVTGTQFPIHVDNDKMDGDGDGFIHDIKSIIYNSKGIGPTIQRLYHNGVPLTANTVKDVRENDTIYLVLSMRGGSYFLMGQGSVVTGGGYTGGNGNAGGK